MSANWPSRRLVGYVFLLPVKTAPLTVGGRVPAPCQGEVLRKGTLKRALLPLAYVCRKPGGRPFSSSKISRHGSLKSVPSCP